MLFAIPSLLTFGAYLKTVCPTMYTGDSGELSFAISTMGIAHPPGYPLLTLLGRVFLILIPGNPAYTLNLFSAFLAASAVGVSAFVARTVLFPVERRNDAGPVIISSITALLWGFSNAFWGTAVGIEVYSLGALIIVLSLMSFLKYQETHEQRFLIFSAYLFSLGLANHLTVAVMLLPIVIAMTTWRAPARLWILMGALLIVALSAYLYIPVRSSRNPIADWDHPATLRAFLDHVTARRYYSFVSGIRLDNYLENMWRSIIILSRQLPLFLGLPGIIGVFLPGNITSRTRLVLVLILLFNLLTAALYDIPDIEQYYLPTIFVSCVGLAILLKWVFERFAASWARIAAPAILILALIVTLGRNFAENDQSHNRLAYTYGMDILNSVPRNSILISVGDNSNGSLYYLHYVEGLRPDLEIYDAVKTYRLLMTRLRLAGKDRLRTGRELCLQYMSSNPERSYLVKEHMLRLGSSYDYRELNLTPRGLVYRWGSWPADTAVWRNLAIPLSDSPPRKLDFKGITMLCNLYLSRGEDMQVAGDRNEAARGFRAAIQAASNATEASVHSSLGVFLRRQGWPVLAEDEYDKALRAEHLTAFEKANVYVNIGNLRKDSGKMGEAVEYYNRALKINRANLDAHYNLAIALAYSSLRQGQFRGAAEEFEKALAISKSDPRLYFNLGVIYDKNLNDTTRAISNYQQFARLAPDTQEGEAARQRIQELRH